MRTAARVVGALVAIAAGYYFVRQASSAWSEVDLHDLLSWKAAALSGAALLIYLAQIPLAAVVWRWILGDMDVRIPGLPAYAIVASTQFAKYLPGNVAQHIGRVAVGRSFGGDVPRLTLSLVYENVIALLAAVHVTVAFLALRASPALDSWLPMGSKALLLVAATLGAALTFLLLPQLAAWLQRRRAPDAAAASGYRPSPRRLLLAYCVFLPGFLALGLAFTLLTHAADPAAGFPFPSLCGAFAAAWVIGLLVPGAPAGLGVREGVLVVLLEGVTGSGAAVAAIALLRMVTTLGDLLHFLLGTWLLRTMRKRPAPARPG